MYFGSYLLYLVLRARYEIFISKTSYGYQYCLSVKRWNLGSVVFTNVLAVWSYSTCFKYYLRS